MTKRMHQARRLALSVALLHKECIADSRVLQKLELLAKHVYFGLELKVKDVDFYGPVCR